MARQVHGGKHVAVATLATEARSLFDSKHGETTFSGRRCWDKNLSSMIALKQRLVDIVNDGLENSSQRNFVTL